MTHCDHDYISESIARISKPGLCCKKEICENIEQDGKFSTTNSGDVMFLDVMMCNKSKREVLQSNSQSQVCSSPTRNALKRHNENGDCELECSADPTDSSRICEKSKDLSSNTDEATIESDLICDFTEPSHLTMTIRRPENILKLLTEKNYGENGAKSGVSAIIRSHSEPNTPNPSPKLLTSKEFCKFLKSYKLTIKPFGAAKSNCPKIENSKRKFSSTSRWRCAANHAKTRHNTLKWHHTYFNHKPKRSPSSTPSFVTSLSQAYLDLATRDQALAETLKTTPTQNALKYTTRSDDPCLLSAARIESPGIQMLANSELQRCFIKKKSDLLRNKSVDCCETDDEGRILPKRNQDKENADETFGKNDCKIDHQQWSLPFQEVGNEAASILKSLKENEVTMETMELPNHCLYPTSSSSLQTSNIFPYFTDKDLSMADEILRDDIFDDQNIFMQEFFPESTFTDCPFTAQNDPTYFSSVEPQNPLPGATSSILGSVAHGSLPMTQHPSPMSSPGSLQKTPPYEHSGYLQDGYSSPDSGFNSPDSLTSPTIDACEWKNDARSQVYFEYAVPPQSLSPEAYTPLETAEQSPKNSPAPKFINMDLFKQEQKPLENLKFTEVPSPYSGVPSPVTNAPSPEPHLTGPVTKTDKKPIKKTSKPARKGRPKHVLLWEFIRDILLDPKHCPSLIKWEDRKTGLFRFVESDTVASMWGKTKRNPKMNYEKLSRAMRYYYNRGILDRVDGRRLVYKFGANAHGWRANSSPEKVSSDIVASSEPVFESTAVAKWRDNDHRDVAFVSDEAAGLNSLEAGSPSGQLLPSASVLLPKWESTI